MKHIVTKTPFVDITVQPKSGQIALFGPPMVCGRGHKGEFEMRRTLKTLIVTSALVSGIAIAPALYAQSTEDTPDTQVPAIGQDNMMGQANMAGHGDMTGQGNMAGHGGMTGQGNMAGMMGHMTQMAQMMDGHSKIMKSMMEAHGNPKPATE